MTIFYHVSTDLKHNGVFQPRVPSSRHQDAEDDKTPRVSVGLTIDDCFTAIPGGGGRLDELNVERRGYYLVYKIDTEKLGIKSEHIVSSDELYEKDLVRDANFTNEHWITVPFTVPKEDAFMIRLFEWQEDPEDVIPHSLMQIAEEKYEGDYLEAYQEEIGGFVPCSIRVYDLEYVEEQVKEGEEITIYYDFEEEKEAVLLFIQENLDADVTDVSMDEITFTVNQNVNVKPLFMHHANVAMLQI